MVDRSECTQTISGPPTPPIEAAVGKSLFVRRTALTSIGGLRVKEKKIDGWNERRGAYPVVRVGVGGGGDGGAEGGGVSGTLKI